MRGVVNHLRAQLTMHRSLALIPCPGCGSSAREPLLKYDRYLLPVHVSLCSNCGLVYTARTINGEALQQFYSQHYRRFYEQVQEVTPAYVHRSRDKLAAAYRMHRLRDIVGDVASVLEIGSGLGYFLDECRSADVQQLLGLELGEAFAHYSQEQLGLGDKVQQKSYQDMSTLPFTPQLVALFHVFEHLEHPCDFLNWIKPKMASGGWLLIEVPNILGDWSSLGIRNFHIAHRTYFCAESLCNMLAANGFTPRYVVSDNTDGIFPGNLSIYAQATSVDQEIYPLPVPQQKIRLKVKNYCKPLCLRTGYPRSAIKLARQMVRG